MSLPEGLEGHSAPSSVPSGWWGLPATGIVFGLFLSELVQPAILGELVLAVGLAALIGGWLRILQYNRGLRPNWLTKPLSTTINTFVAIALCSAALLLLATDRTDNRPAVSNKLVAAPEPSKPNVPHVAPQLLQSEATSWAEVCVKFRASEQYSEAESACLHATQLNSADPSAWYGLAEVYVKAKNYPSAESALREAARLAPNDLDSLVLLGVVLMDQGKNQQVWDVYDRLLVLDPKLASGFEKIARKRGITR